MKTFDTLYKRTKTGAIQYWKIEVKSYPNTIASDILKESGQLGTTSPIKHLETVYTGKQKRTVEQQAVFQAESDWKKKKDEGYKHLGDLGIAACPGQDYCIINTAPMVIGSLCEMLQRQLPQFNTDVNGNIKPMLATDWKKVKTVTFPCLCQPKLDGVRCLMIVDTDSTPIVRFLSRSGKDYTTLGHIASDVILFASEPLGQPVSFILDGEVYSDELGFQDIIRAVKKKRPESLKLKFRAYDVVSDALQEDREYHVKRLVGLINSLHIQPIETNTVYNEDQVITLHNNWVKQGYEGAMLRMLDGIYGQGQRSRSLLKVKEFNETEFRFYGFEVGKRDEDLIALCTTWEGIQFKAKMIGSRKQKEELYVEHQGENITPKTVLTVKHFGWTDDGLPRFPIGKAIRDYD